MYRTYRHTEKTPTVIFQKRSQKPVYEVSAEAFKSMIEIVVQIFCEELLKKLSEEFPKQLMIFWNIFSKNISVEIPRATLGRLAEGTSRINSQKLFLAELFRKESLKKSGNLGRIVEILLKYPEAI